MSKLTLDQKAQRRTFKKNNKVKRKMPLFEAMDAIPDDWMTDIDTERQNIYLRQTRFSRWLQERKRDHIWHWRLAAIWRECCRKWYTEEEIAVFDDQRNRMTKHGFCAGYYAADFWRHRIWDAVGIKKLNQKQLVNSHRRRIYRDKQM